MDLQQWSQQWADSQIKEALEEGVDTTNDSEEQTEQCSHGEVAIGCGIHPFLERLLYLRIRPLLAPLLQVHCCVYYVLAGLFAHNNGEDIKSAIQVLGVRQTCPHSARPQDTWYKIVPSN